MKQPVPLCDNLLHKIYSNWYYREGGPTPFLPMENVCFPIFSHGEKWEKSIWKEREKYSFPSLSIYFFPIFPHEKKWENKHFSMGKNRVGPPYYRTVYTIPLVMTCSGKVSMGIVEVSKCTFAT